MHKQRWYEKRWLMYLITFAFLALVFAAAAIVESWREVSRWVSHLFR